MLTIAPVTSGGAPNRPLPPTPDEEESGDRTLVMRRVCVLLSSILSISLVYCNLFYYGFGGWLRGYPVTLTRSLEFVVKGEQF